MIDVNNNQKRLLIVEDDQFLRDFYQELLSGKGYTVDTAGDGELAQTKILQGGWDLILLDIMLPKKDGLHILKDLQGQKMSKANGPIVVLTNLGNDTIINQAFTLGASGYLVKSAMNPDEVLSQVDGFLKSGNHA